MIEKLSEDEWKDRAGHFGHGEWHEQIGRKKGAKVSSGHGD